jgi:hypothetical protein
MGQVRRGYVSTRNNRYTWEGGVLSGWRVTTALDTVINASLAYGVKTVLKDETAVSGDDALFFVEGEDEADELVKEYELSVGVNRRKFFTDGERAEFLRYLMVKGRRGRVGYPARMWVGYMLTQAFSGQGIQVASELLKGCEGLLQRGMDRLEIGRQAVARLADHFSCTEREAWEYIHTPASVGGGGWWPTSTVWRVPKKRNLNVERGRMVTAIVDWDELPDGDKATIDNCGELLGVEGFRGVARMLTLKQPPQVEREELVEIESVPNGIALPAYRSEVYRRPKLRVDPIFAKEIVRFSPRSWRGVVEPDELVRCAAIENMVGRGRFIEWLFGEVDSVSVAADVFGSLDVRDMVDSLGGWLPTKGRSQGPLVWRARLVATEELIRCTAQRRFLD